MHPQQLRVTVLKHPKLTLKTGFGKWQQDRGRRRCLVPVLLLVGRGVCLLAQQDGLLLRIVLWWQLWHSVWLKPGSLTEVLQKMFICIPPPSGCEASAANPQKQVRVDRQRRAHDSCEVWWKRKLHNLSEVKQISKNEVCVSVLSLFGLLLCLITEGIKSGTNKWHLLTGPGLLCSSEDASE